MRTTLFATASIALILMTACGGQTSTINVNNTANANNQSPTANTNDQTNSSSPQSAPGKTEAQQKLEEYVKAFFAKPMPQKLSKNPQYQDKIAVFRKDKDNYIYIPASESSPSYSTKAEL